MFNENEMNPVESAGWADALTHNLGAVINALTLLAITALVVFFGLKPATRALLAEAPPMDVLDTPLLGASPGFEPAPMLAQPAAPTQIERASEPPEPQIEAPLRLKNPTQRRLELLIDSDETQAAAILKQWMRSEGRA